MRTGQFYPLLRPVMRLLHYRLERRMRQLPQPTDSPHVHAPGPDADRVLLFGSGPAVGYGVLSNELALPGHLARQLSAVTGRGVDVDVVADGEVTIEGSVARLATVNLWRYDAILLTIGVNNALTLTSLPVWRKAVGALLRHVAEHVPARTRVLVVAVPPMRAIDSMTAASGWIADQHAVVLNRETRRIVQGIPHFTFVPFSPIDSGRDATLLSTDTYQRWAAIMVAPLARALTGEPREHEPAPDAADEEEVRARAVASTGILDTPREARFDRIADLARDLLGTDFASIVFTDRQRHWIKAGQESHAATVARAGSFSDVVLGQQGALFVEDARQDERFVHHPHVVGEPRIRAFAGYPIETELGTIGVVTASSRTPRQWDPADGEVLRDLALRVRRELEAS